MGSLLDVSAGDEIEAKIRSIVRSEKIEINSLKTQKKGSAVTANLEIKLPKNLTVDQASKTSDKLKAKLIENIATLQYVAIQIASHEVETAYYEPGFGRSYTWQRRGRFKKESTDPEGQGPGGFCVCEKCGYKAKHEKGIPCSQLKCPTCKTELIRQEGNK